MSPLGLRVLSFVVLRSFFSSQDGFLDMVMPQPVGKLLDYPET